MKKRLANAMGTEGAPPIRVAHVTPARVSLEILMAHRLRLIREAGYVNTGISGDMTWVSIDDGSVLEEFIGLEHLTRRWDPVSDIRAFWELLELFRDRKFDIVTTYGPKPGVLGRIAARVAGVPAIVHVNWGLMFSEESSLLRKWTVLGIEAIAAQFGDSVMSVNSDDMRYLDALQRAKLTGRSKVTYLGNACDLSVFMPENADLHEVQRFRRSWGARNGQVVVGMVARLVAEKGCLEFIEASKIVKEDNEGVVFVAVGPEDRGKRDGIDVGDAGQHVKVTGFVGNMVSAYAAMDIVVLPSHREGFPRTLVEAAAMGKPIVTTDTRGCREAVLPGENGYVVPVGDAVALARAIKLLVRDPKLRESAGNRSRALALERYDDRQLVERMLRVYGETQSTGRWRRYNYGALHRTG